MNGSQPEGATLIVLWEHEVGGLANAVFSSFQDRFGLKEVGEIEPVGFFALDGVVVKHDVVQFPLSKFYLCQPANICLFRSHAPGRDYFNFLTQVLDFAANHLKVKQFLTIGGVVTAIAHVSPRRVFGIVNRPELKESLALSNVQVEIDYQSPPGAGTSLSNYLLWVAQRRQFPGCTLWVEVPFYLAQTRDPMAWRHVLNVLNQRFGLMLGSTELDEQIRSLNKAIQELRTQNSEVSRYIELLERGIMLSESEGETLVKEVTRFLQGQN